MKYFVRKLSALIMVGLFVLATGTAVARVDGKASAPNSLGEQIWQIVSQDSEFTKVLPSSAQELLKPAILKIPELLHEVLDKKASFGTIFKAKYLYHAEVLQSGTLKKVLETQIPDKQFIAAALANQAILLGSIGEKADYIDEVIKEKAIPETKIIEGLEKIFGLNSQNMAKYKEGKLSIRDILLTQPLIIIRAI